MRGNRTPQYQATTCRHHGSFDSGSEERCRASGGPSSLRRHDVLLWLGIPVRLWGYHCPIPAVFLPMNVARWRPQILTTARPFCDGF
jgi:hypothetical protein